MRHASTVHQALGSTRQLLLSVVVCCGIEGAPASVFADEEIPLHSERAREILLALIGAQEALASAFPSGMLQAECENRYDRQRASVLNLWSGTDLFVEATIEQQLPDGQGQLTVSKETVMQIHRERESTFLSLDANLLQVVHDGRFRGWKILKLRPSDCWFRLSVDDDISWIRVLNSLLTPSAEKDLTGGILMKSNGDIEVKTVHVPSASQTSMTFSMSQGGNVIAFHMGSNSGSVPWQRRGLMEWEELADGRWYLKRYESQMGNGEDVDFDTAGGYFITVTRFEANPEIPNDRFLRTSLPLKPGMMVHELGANERRYRLGDDSTPETAVSDEQFERLSNRLREFGFGDPSRAKDRRR
jgi:hypothetical protein